MDSIKQLLINYYIKGLWSPFNYAQNHSIFSLFISLFKYE